MWRDRRIEPPRLGHHSLSWYLPKPGYDLAVSLFSQPGLNGLPVAATKCVSQSSGEHCFADPRVSTRDNDSQGHSWASAITVVSRSNMRETVDSSTLSVTEIRRRAAFAGTVGGRMARMSNPAACICCAMRKVRALSPRITGRI